MGESQRFLEILASIQSKGMALSEWADAYPEPWATVMRFLPISAAFLLGLCLVLLWSRKKPLVQAEELAEEPQASVVQPKSDAEKKLPLVQNELKLTLEKNKRQKERITSAKRALEVKDQELVERADELEKQDKELAKLRLEILAATEAPALDTSAPPIKVEPREDLQEFAAASEQLAQAAVDFRQNLREEKPAEVESGTPEDWDEMLLFRANDPSIWNQPVSEGENHTAVPLSLVPANTAYLRLRRLDTGEGLVIAVQPRDLYQDGGDHIIGFNGSNEEFYSACHLGIYSEDLPQQVEVRFAYGGWGFGHHPENESAQACAWAGQKINDDTVMEITVFPRFPGLTDKDQLIEPS